MTSEQFEAVKAEVDALTDAADTRVDFDVDHTGSAPYARKAAAVYAKHGVTMEEFHSALTSGEHFVPAR